MLSRGARWRLVDTGPMDGASNMAIDEALLEAFDPEASDPVLRLYGWSPPALSLGRFQDAGSVLDLSLCRDRGVPVVRRITGGGVVYHADELTYSVVCPPKPFPGAAAGVDDTYPAFLTGDIARSRLLWHNLFIENELSTTERRLLCLQSVSKNVSNFTP